MNVLNDSVLNYVLLKDVFENVFDALFIHNMNVFPVYHSIKWFAQTSCGTVGTLLKW